MVGTIGKVGCFPIVKNENGFAVYAGINFDKSTSSGGWELMQQAVECYQSGQ